MKRFGLMPPRFVFSVMCGGRMIRAEEQMQNELKYMLALSLIRKLYEDGKLSKMICQRLNRKNAETLGCAEIPLV